MLKYSLNNIVLNSGLKNYFVSSFRAVFKKKILIIDNALVKTPLVVSQKRSVMPSKLARQSRKKSICKAYELFKAADVCCYTLRP